MITKTEYEKSYWDNETPYFKIYESEILERCEIIALKINILHDECHFTDSMSTSRIKYLYKDIYYICLEDKILIEFQGISEKKINYKENEGIVPIHMLLMIMKTEAELHEYYINISAIYINGVLLRSSTFDELHTVWKPWANSIIIYYSERYLTKDKELVPHTNTNMTRLFAAVELTADDKENFEK